MSEADGGPVRVTHAALFFADADLVAVTAEHLPPPVDGATGSSRSMAWRSLTLYRARGGRGGGSGVVLRFASGASPTAVLRASAEGCGVKRCGCTASSGLGARHLIVTLARGEGALRAEDAVVSLSVRAARTLFGEWYGRSEARARHLIGASIDGRSDFPSRAFLLSSRRGRCCRLCYRPCYCRVASSPWRPSRPKRGDAPRVGRCVDSQGRW